jgi:hypothetical protein
MRSSEIANQRLHNQRLSSPDFKKPAEVVQWMGAVQAQDYYGAKWALGQRTQDTADDDVEKAFANGEILRTHVMRPTWHFVTPADIRWLLKLTAPRVNAVSSYYFRKLELDDAVFRRSNKALAKSLRGGKHLTREALREVIKRAGIAGDDLLRFNYMLIRAELDAVICSGPRIGKQFTYALLDERAPETKALSLTRDESLAELTRRYFTSHGPATSSDFMWWSGLTANDVKQGLEMVKNQLVREEIEGKTYWLPASTPTVARVQRLACLLPTYDEYLIAYKDRSAAIDPKRSISDNTVFDSTIIWNGRVVGSWNRKIEGTSVKVTVSCSAPFSQAETRAIAGTVRRYSEFLKKPAVITYKLRT